MAEPTNQQGGVAAILQSEPTPPTMRALQVFALLGIVYIFLCSIELMGGSFKLMGKGFAETLIASTSNPFSGLIIGVLATSLVQSSSTVTSLVVGLVGAGSLSVEMAIPLVMGANIGTSVTNTIVAMGHLTRPQEFKRAFAGATVHDFFNLLAVIVFLPLQLATGFLSKSAFFVEKLLIGQDGLEFKSPLKAIVKPVVKWFEHAVVDGLDNDRLAVGILVVVALAMLMLSLHFLVKLMKRLMLGRVELLMHKYVFEHPLRGILLGTVITILVQSSSVTTSLIVPLLAAGFVNINQIFPFIMGANVGTTITALLASLVTGSSAALTVALCHVFFNVYGIIVFYPLRRIPIWAAELLGTVAMKNKMYAVGYVLLVFFGIPLSLLFLTR